MDGSDSAFPLLSGASPGLTKREWFAGMALSSLQVNGTRKRDIAKFALLVADAMIEELNNGSHP